MITGILLLIFLIIIVVPFLIKKAEENIELFLLIMAVITITVSHSLGSEPIWSLELVKSSLLEPIKLAVATLVFGFLFRMFREPLKKKVLLLEEGLGPRLFAFLLIFTLGIISSVITAIIAALILCEVVTVLNLDKKFETILVILACFSIGMGAALTPIGEPLSTIAIAKLKSGALNTNFLFLLKLLGIYIVPGLILLAAFGGFLRGRQVGKYDSLSEDYAETFRDIALRAIRVYIFVMSLIFLGAGFKPLIDNLISRLSGKSLYWINMTSAVLDNATLAAAELGPHMTAEQIKGILMGVIIAGGMLIPGNIPNIISASKLRISSRAWAVIGIPTGLFLMGLYYVVLFAL